MSTTDLISGRNKRCCTCKWWDMINSVCCNRDSVDSFVLGSEGCEQWESN